MWCIRRLPKEFHSVKADRPGQATKAEEARFGKAMMVKVMITNYRFGYFLGQWLTFKLLGIPYLVGKIKFKLLFQGPLAK